jgi:hypothetical protein
MLGQYVPESRFSQTRIVLRNGEVITMRTKKKEKKETRKAERGGNLLVIRNCDDGFVFYKNCGVYVVGNALDFVEQFCLPAAVELITSRSRWLYLGRHCSNFADFSERQQKNDSRALAKLRRDFYFCFVQQTEQLLTQCGS